MKTKVRYLAHEEAEFSKFLTIPGERLLFYTRCHWLTPVGKIVIATFCAFFVFILWYAVAMGLFSSVRLFIAGLLLMQMTLFILITKIVIDWYYHVFIVTSRKILEVWYTPLFSHAMLSVLLEQVRVTGVESRKENILEEILDVGAVSVTFDWQANEKAFIFSYVANPDLVASRLSDEFELLMEEKKTMSGRALHEPIREPLYISHMKGGETR